MVVIAVQPISYKDGLGSKAFDLDSALERQLRVDSVEKLENWLRLVFKQE